MFAMRYRFLCPHHRQWLMRRPREVAPLWQSGMQAAQSHVARGEWERAFSQVGCAFEAAGLMVSSALHCNRDWLRRLSASEALLRLVVQRLTGESAVELDRSDNTHLARIH